MLKNLKEKLKHHLHEVIRIKKSPHEIALGFAIGTLIGILPTPGFSFLLGLFIVLIFERVNKIALFSALILWNPILLAPIYYASMKLGNLIFGPQPTVIFNITVWDAVYNFSRRYLLGNFIIACFASLMSYIIIYRAVDFYQKKKK